MARYLIIDKAGNVANNAEWDGVTPWDPSESIPDCLIVDAKDAPSADIGSAVVAATVPIIKWEPIKADVKLEAQPDAEVIE